MKQHMLEEMGVTEEGFAQARNERRGLGAMTGD